MELDVRQLALDTLYNRSKNANRPPESCFIFNEAGSKLRNCQPTAIPILEELIRDVISPAMEKQRERYGIPDWNSGIKDGPPFAGLSEFLGAYWVLCARNDPSRAVEFMSKMTRPVVNESVSLLSVFFHPANSLSDVAIPSEYVDYLTRLSASDVDEFRNVADYVIKRLHLKHSGVS
jgi:hypothetical protein